MSRLRPKSVAWYLCRKLSMRPSDGRALPPGVVTAVVGVALSVAIMLISVAVVYGFKRNIIDRLTGFHAQITVTAPDTNTTGFTDGLRLTDSLRHILTEICDVGHDISLIVMQPTVLKTDSAFQGLMLKGLESAPEAWDFVSQNMVSGRVPSLSDTTDHQIVISTVTADALGLGAGDRIMAHFIDGESLRSRRLDITGVYDSHFHDYDGSLAFTPLTMLQRLNHIDSITGTSLEIRGLEPDMVDDRARALTVALFESAAASAGNPMYYTVSTLSDKCAIYINWLDLLDTNVVVIIVLMACVAGFTLISSLFIIILQRVSTIGLLKALGATDALIRRIFILMTQRLVITGLIIGNILGMTFIFVQDKFHLIPLNPEAYYLNYVPVSMPFGAWIAINVATLIMAALILIIPSHIIAGISPAKSIRYE